LAVTVGDGEKTFQRLLPVFKAFGRNMIYVGPVGYGQAARLVNQMAALNTAAVVEGLRLAKALGLDVEKETQVSSLGAARSGYCICRSTPGRPPARLQGGPPQEGLGLRHGGESAKFISARHLARLGAVQDLWRRASGSWGIHALGEVY
jgi:3-hydroxyisobutyrate dehydrogenase